MHLTDEKHSADAGGEFYGCS
ncbi:unnamed protein product, partial [Adineta ricciae]